MGLKFPTELIPGIRDGKITMQFGLWRRPRVVAGRVYVVKGLGIVRVTAVEKIDLSRLTPWEAEAAGARDISEIREWLKREQPDGDPSSGEAYRVRFRYLGPESKDSPVDEEGDTQGDDEEDTSPSPVPPKAIPADLMDWVNKREWRQAHLKTLANGVWRNADDISKELDVDSATTRRRMGDLRKRGLVTSHRHHGYRISPEGRGALEKMVDRSSDGAGSSAAGWLKAKGGRSEIIETLIDGKWHNAAELGEILDISVVSVQRRVAALRDRGLVESHRRRGYRLTPVGFEAIGNAPGIEAAREALGPTGHVELQETAPSLFLENGEQPHEESAPVVEEPRVGVRAPDETSEPLPSSLLEWLEVRPYRKELLYAIPSEEYVSSGELSDVLHTSITALHGRLKTLKDRGLVEALPRRGYRTTKLGNHVVDVLRAIAMRRPDEPEGAAAFLSAESPGWGVAGTGDAATAKVPQARDRSRWWSSETCGFCHATAHNPPIEGWIAGMQANLESSPDEASRIEPIGCNRGVMEDSSWFLVVERDPLAEGHCKLVCKEHVWDLVELGRWALRDQALAQVRDSLARDLILAVDVIMGLDPHIEDVIVLSGLEHGAHLHFDLVPRYRMDLPGLRPLASSRAHYDDLSLVRKRRLWLTRREHLEDVANRLRSVARKVIGRAGTSVMSVSGP